MLRSLLAALAGTLILAAPAQAACPGADPCPYTASSVVGLFSCGAPRLPPPPPPRPPAAAPPGARARGGGAWGEDNSPPGAGVLALEGTFKRELGATAKGPGGLSSIGG